MLRPSWENSAPPPQEKDPAHQTTEAPWEVRGLQQGVEALRAGRGLGQESQTHLPNNKAMCGNLILRKVSEVGTGSEKQ